MKAITKLKDEARRHEQNDDWEKAIQAYLQVLRVADEGEGEVELPLYNRIGDLYVRLGRPQEGVSYYEQAADRYADAGLYNNAIALCNKALRYHPENLELVRKLGRFSASQGFLSDARRHFIDFAERSFRSGQEEDGFGALEELARASDDPEMWELLGRRLQETGRTDRAVNELQRAWALRRDAGDTAAADALREEIRALDPDARLPGEASLPFGDSPFAVEAEDSEEVDDVAEAAPAAPADDDAGSDGEPLAGLEGPGHSAGDDDGEDSAAEVHAQPLDGFESTALGDDDDSDDVSAFALPDLQTDEPAIDEDDLDPDVIEGLESTTVDFAAAAAAFETSGETDPDMERDEPFGWAGEDEGPPVADHTGAPDDLPWADDEVEDAAADENDDPFAGLPMLDDEPVDDPPGGEPPGDEQGDAFAGMPALDEAPTGWDQPVPDDDDDGVDAGEGLPVLDGATVLDAGLATQHEEAARRELAAAHAAPPPPDQLRTAEEPDDDGFIDLASLLAEEAEDTTRFRVEEAAPSGDEEHDFAELLTQFKAKLSAHVPPEDAAAHYDLGLAFKEMGLVDEAIAEFQVAMRAGHMRLKVFEELGQCFLQKNQHNIAEKVLRRALELRHDDELELLGVYYYLGRAYEQLNRPDQASDAYERVLGLDINFRDAAERLSRL